MCFTFVDFKFETFYVVSTMLDIVDHEIKGITSKIFVWKVIICTLYIKMKFCVFFFLDDVNEYYSMKNSWLRYNFELKMIDLNPDHLSER